MDHLSNSKPNLLRGLRVGLSCAVPDPEDWGEIPDLDRVFLTYVAQFSSLVLQYGGQIVHGSTRAFTPVLAEQARSHGKPNSSQLRLYASELYGARPEATREWAKTGQATLKMTPRVGGGSERDQTTRNDSLTALRMAITGDIDVMVAVGGKVEAGSGDNPGQLEIMAQARWRDVPCFLVAAFGAASSSVSPTLLALYSKGNLLSDREILLFATPSSYMVEGVGKLVLHLIKHRDTFARLPEKPVAPAMANIALGQVEAAGVRNVSIQDTKSHVQPDGLWGTSAAFTSFASSGSEPASVLSMPPEEPEVIQINSDEVRKASERFGELCSAMRENTIDSAAQLLERPDFLS